MIYIEFLLSHKVHAECLTYILHLAQPRQVTLLSSVVLSAMKGSPEERQRVLDAISE